MKIQIDGINTQNKGAELMLVAILEEIEKRYPGATIYLNPDAKLNKDLIPKYNLKIITRLGLKVGRYFNSVAFRLNVKQPFQYFRENYAPKNIDIILDASGFKYSDQWNRTIEWIEDKEKYYSQSKSNGTKLFFLTQALGPFNTTNGLRSIKMLEKYCDIIFARDDVSYNYANEVIIDKHKLKKSCDFTFKVKGVVTHYANLKGAIGIIPNRKMITHGGDAANKYVDLLLNIITYFENKGEKVFLLNHEGEGDYDLCNKINAKRTKKLDIVTNLPAKEIKGIIGQSKMIITSRFHGVASALSQGVPCIATSWNHKYEMLFRDFGQSNCIIKANDTVESNLFIVERIYENVDTIKIQLQDKKLNLIKKIDEMWNSIFNYYEDLNKG